MTAAAKTNDVYVAVAWSGNLWKEADLVTAVEGTGTALAVKTAAKNTAKVETDAAKSTCTSSVGFTIPKAAANVKIAAVKEKGIAMGDVGTYATVKALQAKPDGCLNAAEEVCPAGTASAGALKGGAGVYQSVKEPNTGFLWAVSIKAAAAADGAAADAKKSATTLAIGAAAGLVAAAIA